MLLFRKTVESDLQGILEIEKRFEEFVGQWTLKEHLASLHSTGTAHLVFFDEINPLAGYAILRGLNNENRSMELMRIAVAVPGMGYGKAIIVLMQKWCFYDLKAHRLWLDVRVHNVRARHVYKAMGFVEEGILRDAVLRDGKYESLAVMSILDEEYRQRS